jgi:hypothetical protein
MERSLCPNHFVESRQILLEDDPIEKQQRIERLVLRRRCDSAVDSQRREEAGDLAPPISAGWRLP